MTDAEIIKALECCTNKGAKCSDCPAFKKVDRSDCKKYFRGAIDLINRQQVEIEELKIENKSLRSAANSYKMHFDVARNEAVKEFAERLKEEIDIRPTHSNEQNKYVCFLIDNLVKEMASGTSVQKTANLTKEKS